MAAVAEGRRRQNQLAAEGLDGIVAKLTELKYRPVVAAQQLNLSPADIEALLTALGATVGRRWRKEQKLACLSAWVALAALNTRQSTHTAKAPQQL